jgi:hypothetical protein
MGINWAATLLAGVSLVLAVFPFIFYRYGPRIRSGSRFAPCMVSSILAIFIFIFIWWSELTAYVGAGSQGGKRVGCREKKTVGRGIDATRFVANDMDLL